MALSLPIKHMEVMETGSGEGEPKSRIITFTAPEGAGQPVSGCHLKPTTQTRPVCTKLCLTHFLSSGPGQKQNLISLSLLGLKFFFYVGTMSYS